MKRKLNSKKHKPAANQDGVALITAIFSLLLATVIGLALFYSSSIAFTVAKNERDNTEAFYLAEGGYNHAFALLSKVQKSHFTTILRTGDGQANTGDELSTPPATGLWTSAESIPAGNKNSGGITGFGANGTGRYWVTVKNDTSTGETPNLDINGIIIITATGVGRDGSTATVEGTINVGNSYPALLVNGNLRLSGNVEVHGLNGSVHVNGNLQNNGNPCADLYFSTTGTITDPSGLKGPGCIGVGVARTNQPFISPPVYNIPNDFKSQADYVLGATGSRAGNVYNKSGALIFNTNTASKNTWTSGGMSWKYDSATKVWEQSGGMASATFYSEGNVKIGGNFGTSTFPTRVTLIAEGFIQNKGSQYLAPALGNYSLISGTDILLKGKLSSGDTDDFDGEGLIYAHHQIDFSGSPIIRGRVVAANIADTISPGGVNLVPLGLGGYIQINGNASIISNATQNGNGIKTISWREVRQ